ncbi:MAG: hypothetical protein IJB38_04955 [Bacteroidales bacterium]|nr:hypothetical protein [Bacteroidales bacterium]
MADYLLSLRGVKQEDNMLISLIVGLVLALIFGKITVKEIKHYVRKYTERHGKGNSAAAGNGEKGEEGKEDLPEEGEKVKD